jgi:ATP-dependent Clp protease ATP-binding subunit ClpC
MVSPVLDRFSDRSRRVVALAEEEAGRLGHQYVGTEHLLLGLLVEGESSATHALIAGGASLDAARQKVTEAVGRSDRRTGGDLPLSVRASRALDRASRLSLQRRDALVEPEHILLGVLDVEGTAGQVLRGIGVDVVALRAVVDRGPVERPAGAAAPRSAAEGVSPFCPVCGAALEAVLAHRVIHAAGPPRQPRGFIVAYCSACGSALGATPA